MMLISELAFETGVPVATIKFYLREGVLPAGHPVGPTRATYDDHHVRRLRLIRALVTVGGLRLAQVREVVANLDRPVSSTHHFLGSVHEPLAGPAGPTGPTNGTGSDAAAPSAAVDTLLDRLGWRVESASAHRQVLARALDACAEVGHPVDDETLDVYAEAALAVANRDVDLVPVTEPELALETVVIGTVLREPILLALRRLAQHHVSAGRFPDE